MSDTTRRPREHGHRAASAARAPARTEVTVARETVAPYVRGAQAEPVHVPERQEASARACGEDGHGRRTTAECREVRPGRAERMATRPRDGRRTDGAPGPQRFERAPRRRMWQKGTRTASGGTCAHPAVHVCHAARPGAVSVRGRTSCRRAAEADPVPPLQEASLDGFRGRGTATAQAAVASRWVNRTSCRRRQRYVLTGVPIAARVRLAACQRVRMLRAPRRPPYFFFFWGGGQRTRSKSASER